MPDEKAWGKKKLQFYGADVSDDEDIGEASHSHFQQACVCICAWLHVRACVHVCVCACVRLGKAVLFVSLLCNFFVILVIHTLSLKIPSK